MTDKKVTDFLEREFPALDDWVMLVAAGSNWKGSLANVLALATGGGGLVTSPIVLLTSRTTDGTDGGVDWGGGPGLVSVYGVFDGAAVQLAYSPDGGATYIDTDGVLLSGGDSTMSVAYPAGKVRATISGAGGTTDLSARLESTR